MPASSVLLAVGSALLLLIGVASAGPFDFGASGAHFQREYHGNDKIGRDSVWRTDKVGVSHQWESKDGNTRGGLYGEHRQHDIGGQTFRDSAIGANIDHQLKLGRDGNWQAGAFAEHKRPAVGKPENVFGVKITKDF